MPCLGRVMFISGGDALKNTDRKKKGRFTANYVVRYPSVPVV